MKDWTRTALIPAYVCGRLMAEFESLQRASSESEVNSSVLDRYFALASTYPSVAFPKIESLAQKHLRKLRRDKPNAGVCHRCAATGTRITICSPPKQARIPPS